MRTDNQVLFPSFFISMSLLTHTVVCLITALNLKFLFILITVGFGTFFSFIDITIVWVFALAAQFWFVFSNSKEIKKIITDAMVDLHSRGINAKKWWFTITGLAVKVYMIHLTFFSAYSTAETRNIIELAKELVIMSFNHIFF